MNEETRPGFEVAKVTKLSEGTGDRLLEGFTPEELFLMVWELTRNCWALVPGAENALEQRLLRHVEHVQRGKR